MQRAPQSNKFPQIRRERVSVESLAARYERYLHLFDFDLEKQTALGEVISQEVVRGKADPARREPGSASAGELAMLDTCVEKAPTGQECGVFYAVDFGGSNLRCVRTELKGHGQATSDAETREIRAIPTRKELARGLLDRNATATELFDAMAALVKLQVLKHHDQPEKPIPVGFTFSYPMAQVDIDSAEALRFTKGFETGSNTRDKVVGRGIDLGLLLNKALQRAMVPAQVTAILNDTTGTLISGGYSLPPDQPTCLIGAILGTGINVCYADPEARAYGYIGSLLNTEIGGLRSGLSRNIIDFEVDDADTNPGAQILEKMVSGRYLPEICRRAILKVFQEKAPPLTWNHWQLRTGSCMKMAYEFDRPGAHKDNASAFPETKRALVAELGWDESSLTPGALWVCSGLCRAVVRRSARIFAVCIGSLARFTGRLQPALGGLSVAVDGSVYVLNPEFQRDVGETLSGFLGEDLAALIHFVTASDGSGVGAAILAAMPHKFKKTSFSPPGVVSTRA